VTKVSKNEITSKSEHAYDFQNYRASYCETITFFIVDDLQTVK